MVHIYLICILCVHILWCHNCPYYILVCIQVGDIEKRLLECVEKARDEKEKAEEECYSVKGKAKDLKFIVGTWCGNVWWGIGAFGTWDRRLHEANGTSRKAHEVKYISIYGCTLSNYGITWCGRKSAVLSEV